ncbi:hypothetical protein GH714_007411 [Hevea brasiliensis]|uniref:Uncharacterized protein n=1 Tax=Hevea brasiliensis TaxID=3981 RepID=A0A6A6M981_HEVBR|nr:hypothetical protein GH714_007411 [Hevea brasiliensis]
MASMSSFERWTVNRLQIVSKSTAKQKQEPSKLFLLPVPTSRRCAILISALPLGLILLPPLSEARERRNKKAIPLEDYLTTSDGLKYYDVVKGKGPIAEKGLTVQVHFDCLYRVITAVSSRESKLLAGNRIIAQVIISFSQQNLSIFVCALIPADKDLPNQTS